MMIRGGFVYKVVDVNDFVCLRHKNGDDVIDEYVQVVSEDSLVLDRVGAFAIKQVPENSETGKKLLGRKNGSLLNIKGHSFKIAGIYNEEDLLKATISFFEELGMYDEARKYINKIKKRKR